RDSAGSITLFELPSGRQLRRFEIGSGRGEFAYHPGGRQLSFADVSRPGIQIRDVETGAMLKELPQAEPVEFLAWHPHGKTLATVGADRIIRIWDVESGKPTLQLKGHTNDGIKFAFSHGGKLLASTQWGHLLHLWDPHTGEQLFQTRQAAMA